MVDRGARDRLRSSPGIQVPCGTRHALEHANAARCPEIRAPGGVIA
ncbi:hypothetical protein ACFSEO_11850 [Agromyces cerinus subsp. nitratus]